MHAKVATTAATRRTATSEGSHQAVATALLHEIARSARFAVFACVSRAQIAG